MGGEYFACGVGAALAGRGAHFLIVDDPFSEQDVLNGNYEVFDRVYEWFTYGARTRLMPQGKVAIVHTRWHPNDLIGKLAKDMSRTELADQYDLFEFPAIFNENTDDEKALWPEFYDLEALHRTKASMPLFQWNAQYQQNPTAEEGALVKREWWRKWEADDPPQCEYIIMALDAAAETNNRADFTAITTWGVFSDDNLTQSAAHLMLLNVINVRVEFPELKTLALEEYKEWEPDSFIVEKKSNGTPLFQELRRLGIPVQEFTPHRGTGDKIARINAISDIFRSGMVWYPAGRKWAEEAVEQLAAFPASEHDDVVDCISMSLSRFRQGGFIRLPTDEPDDIRYFKSRKGGYY
jgi:predicted phage terminase large subunit-like protein